jgi:hypothetical protein
MPGPGDPDKAGPTEVSGGSMTSMSRPILVLAAVLAAGGPAVAQTAAPPAAARPTDAAPSAARRPTDATEIERLLPPSARPFLGAPAPRSAAFLPQPPLLPRGRPPGFAVGQFVILPGAAASVAYDDNSGADDSGGDAALIGTASANVRAQSTYRRHALGFDAGVTQSGPLAGDANADLDWSVGTDGRLDLTPRTQADARIALARTTPDVEDAESEDVNASTTLSGSAGLRQRFATFSTGALLSGAVIREDNTAGARRFDDPGRDDEREVGDRVTYGISFPTQIPVSYRLQLGVTPFWRRTLTEDNPGEDTQDVQTFGASVNVSIDIAGGLTFSASTGLVGRVYDDGRSDFDPNNALVFDWSLSRPLGGSTIADVALSRSVNDTSVSGASSRISTQASAGVTRIVRSDISLRGSVGGGRSSFEDTGRDDDSVFASLVGSWQIDDRVSLTASLRHSRRFSSDDDSDFTRNLAVLGVQARF